MKINLNFIEGAFVEIIDDNDDFLYNVQFINKKTNEPEYSIDLRSNQWAKCSKAYYIDWQIVIKGIDTNYYYEYNMKLKDRKVFMCFESKSVGDTFAWFHQVEKFRLKHNCKLICSTFHNDLFSNQYPEMEFVEPGATVYDVFALYRIGIFYSNDGVLEMHKHPTNPLKIPLAQIGSDILGLDYEELKPLLPQYGKVKKKRVCIAVHSTAQCKYWNNPKGWQEVVDYLVKEGYEVRLLSTEKDGTRGNRNPKGITLQEAGPLRKLVKVLQESEFFIGISSGLSWMSWACDIPTIIISGFTDENLEPKKDNIIRIINKNVCNGCWATHNPFEIKYDWHWCPVHKDTERQFECTKTITGEDVIKQIKIIRK